MPEPRAHIRRDLPSSFARKRIAFARSNYKYFFLAGAVFGFVAACGFVGYSLKWFA